MSDINCVALGPFERLSVDDFIIIDGFPEDETEAHKLCGQHCMRYAVTEDEYIYQFEKPVEVHGCVVDSIVLSWGWGDFVSRVELFAEWNEENRLIQI